MRKFLVVSALTLLGSISAANAAPIAKTPQLSSESSTLDLVHYRGYRHCHWRSGHRWCHGGGPSVILRFGDKHRHHRHHGDRDHRRH
jgi:hypothetical protein